MRVHDDTTTRVDPVAWVQDELATIRALKRERFPFHLASAPGPDVELDGRRLIHLCSNNYLGLAAHPLLIERAVLKTLEEGYRTADIYSEGTQKISCSKMGDLVAEKIK